MLYTVTMTKKYIAANFDTFTLLFTQLANQPNSVCWMRSLDYERQLYISQNFETVFGKPCHALYENPTSWNDFLLPIDSNNILKTIDTRLTDLAINDGNNHMFFRIGTPEGNIRYLRDWSIIVYDKFERPIAIAGVGENLSPEQWYQSIQQIITDSSTTQPNNLNINSIIEQEARHLGLTPQNDMTANKTSVSLTSHIRVNNLSIALSSREAECLYHLRQGKTAKETAEALFLSPRTIETHIDNIKQKACVRTKLELLTQLQTISDE